MHMVRLPREYTLECNIMQRNYLDGPQGMDSVSLQSTRCTRKCTFLLVQCHADRPSTSSHSLVLLCICVQIFSVSVLHYQLTVLLDVHRSMHSIESLVQADRCAPKWFMCVVLPCFVSKYTFYCNQYSVDRIPAL